jgi:hypothetical protein
VARPNWEYIRIDVLLPEHPKIEGLSDNAFRALVELWCYCGRNRTDGIVTEKRWKKSGSKGAREELVGAGLAEPIGPGGGTVMHDFTGPDGHQRTRAEIDELSAKRTEAAKKAAAARWGDAKTHGASHA